MKCPKCGAKMWEGERGFYCRRVGCNGVVKKEKADISRDGDKKRTGKAKKRAKKTHEGKARPR